MTWQFAPYNGDVSITINGSDLQPGDALNNDHHIVLFAKWTNKAAGKAWVMEELNCSKVAMAHEITLSISGTSVYSGWHSDSFTAIRFKNIQTVIPNAPPKGSLDAANCDGISGWAQDPDTPDKALEVQIYLNGQLGSSAASSFPLTADNHRDDLCTAIQSCKHGFWSSTPLSLKDGLPHEVHVYAIDTGGGKNPEIGSKTLTCAAPIPAGVRRHIISPASLAAWKFSTFWQMVTLSDTKLQENELGPKLPENPVLVQADDGTPEVWFIDGQERRHIPNPDIAATWKLDLGKVQKRPSAEVYGLPQGAPLRPSPFLVKGSGPEIYLIDDPPTPSDPSGDEDWSPKEEEKGGAAGSSGAENKDPEEETDEPATQDNNAGTNASTTPNNSAGTGGSQSTGSGGTGGMDDANQEKAKGTPRVSLRDNTGEQEGGCAITTARNKNAWALSILALLGLRRRKKITSLTL